MHFYATDVALESLILLLLPTLAVVLAASV